MPRKPLYSKEQLAAVAKRVAPVIEDRTPSTASPDGAIKAAYDIPMEYYLNAYAGHGESPKDETYLKDMAKRGLVRKIPYVPRATNVGFTPRFAQGYDGIRWRR